MKPSVLIFADYFTPAYLAGGPIKSLTGLIDHFHFDFQFSMITRHGDWGPSDRFNDIAPDQWQNQGEARIYYARRLGALRTFHLIKEANPHFIYVNSFFSRRYAIVPMVIAKILGVPVLLAPRGEFSEKALLNKPLRKNIYLSFVRRLGLTRHVIFQAASIQEGEQIVAQIPGAVIKVAEDITPKTIEIPGGVSSLVNLEKVPGELRLISLGRVSPIKNLEFTLKFLERVPGNIQFDIWGPIDEDTVEYWKKCESLIAEMPSRIQVKYCGTVAPEQVSPTIRKYHALILPSKSESFGHAIFETLLAGRPVIISDQTPWQNLGGPRAGWVLELDENRFVEILHELVQMTSDQWQVYALGAYAHARSWLTQSGRIDHSRQMLNDCLKKSIRS